MHLRAVVLSLAVVWVGCGTRPRGTKAVGETCAEAHECRHGLCVGDAAGDDPVCTRSCAAASDCPRGWSCSGVTEENVVVCVRGSSTPFGADTNR